MASMKTSRFSKKLSSFNRTNVSNSVGRRYISDFPGYANVSWFDSGHTFARFGSIGVVATDNSTTYNKGVTTHSALKIQTDGTVSLTDVRSTQTGINATNKILAIAVYCPDFALITEFQVTIGTTGLTNRKRWGAIQGSQGTRWIQGSAWQIITLPWHEGTDAGIGVTRANVTDYQIRVQSTANGVRDLWIGGIAWIDQGTKQGTVSFDDAYSSVFTLGFPVLQASNVKFTLYAPAQYIDSGATRLSQTQINTMLASNLCEIGYHGDGNDQRVYTANQVRALIETDLTYWASKNIPIKSAAYPGGEHGYTTDNVLLADIYSEYFETSRTIFQGQSESFHVPDYSRLRVSSYITNVVTPTTVLTNINSISANEGIHHQVYHELVSTNADITTKYLLTDFTTNINNLATSSLNKATVSQTIS
jgi:peptidoglycan/xylan/chitin deacetylase (PgdA/CDA1 family)